MTMRTIPKRKTSSETFPIIKAEVIMPRTGIIGIFPIFNGTLNPFFTGFFVRK